MSVLRLKLNGTVNLAPYCEDLTVSMAWGQPTTWNGSFVFSENGRVPLPSPLCPPGSGDFANRILPHMLDQTRYLDLDVHQAGVTTKFPRLLASEPDWDHPVLSWGGTDLSALLDRESETGFGDILMDGGGVERTAHQALAEHATAYGHEVACTFPNFPIRELRRGSGGTPRDWNSKIAEVYQCHQEWLHPDTLRFRQANFDPDAGGYDWTFVDRLQVKQGTLRSNAEGVKNSFVLARQEPNARLLGEQELRDPAMISGRTGAITFSRPSRNFTLQAETTGGFLHAVTAYDEANQVTAFSVDYQNSYVSLKGPAVRVQFSFRPSAPGVSQGFFVQAFGGVQKPGGSFSFPVESADSIAQIGRRREVRAIEPELPADAATAQAMADAILATRIRGTWQLPMTTPYANPAIRPGDRLRLVDWLTGGTRIWFVQACKWTWTRSGDLLEIVGIRPWLD